LEKVLKPETAEVSYTTPPETGGVEYFDEKTEFEREMLKRWGIYKEKTGEMEENEENSGV
jgi:hypothetical protein